MAWLAVGIDGVVGSGIVGRWHGWHSWKMAWLAVGIVGIDDGWHS